MLGYSTPVIDPVAVHNRRMLLAVESKLAAYWPLASSGAVNLKSYAPPGPLDLTNNAVVTRAAGPSNNLPDAGNFVLASSQFFSIADGVPLRLGLVDHTWACWAYLASKPAGVMQAIGKGSAPIEHILQWMGSATDNWRYILSDGTHFPNAQATTFGAPALTTWHFIVCGVDTAANRVFIRVNNGAYNYGANTGMATGTSGFGIGADGAGAAPFDGRIAHVGLWRRLLTEAEQTWLYNNGQGRDLVRGV